MPVLLLLVNKVRQLMRVVPQQMFGQRALTRLVNFDAMSSTERRQLKLHANLLGQVVDLQSNMIHALCATEFVKVWCAKNYCLQGHGLHSHSNYCFGAGGRAARLAGGAAFVAAFGGAAAPVVACGAAAGWSSALLAGGSSKSP